MTIDDWRTTAVCFQSSIVNRSSFELCCFSKTNSPVLFVEIQMNRVSGEDFSIQEQQGQPVLNLFLDQALERSGAVHRIISFAGELFDGRG